MINNKFTKNQDLVISIFKYKNVPQIYDVNLMRININFNQGNYKFKIDQLMKNNIIYENYPGFKSNFLIQDDIMVLDSFDNQNFLNLRSLSKILFANFSLNKNEAVKELLEKYNLANSKENNFAMIEIESINKSLLDLYFNSIQNVNNFIQKEENLNLNLDKIYEALKETYLVQSQKFRNSYAANVLNFSTQKIFIYNFQLFKFFYLPNLTLLTSKFVDLIIDNKKLLKDPSGLKTKILNDFKVPLMNYFVDTASALDTSSKALNLKDVTEFFFKSAGSFISGEAINAYRVVIEELAARYHDEQKDILKGIIESSKLYKNFVKESI
jgi:hypothetical protein